MERIPAKKFAHWLISLFCLFAILIYANIDYALVKPTDLSYVLTSFVYILPIVSIACILPRKWMYCTLTIIISIFTIIDLTMIDIYHDYLLPGAIISTLKTNPQESSEFFTTNLREALCWIPIIILCIVSCTFYNKISFAKNKIVVSTILIVMTLTPIIFISSKLATFYESKLTLRYFLDNRVWNRTPYNVVFQSINTKKELNKRKMVDNASNINFNAVKNDTCNAREIYIFSIGESLRYDNLSLNGRYPRTTTPNLQSINNLILFDDYYSQACLTMYSIPQLVTRATPDNYDLNYAERSIIEPFRECGFSTFTIVTNTNLLSYEKYLSYGVDSLIIVPNIINDREILSGDKNFITLIDSLSNIYDKLFVMMQFHGNHSFFTNYEKEFDVYHPNSNSDKDIESDSLLINAYDNSILYTDWILSSIIKKIDKPNTISAMLFMSDHGENITKDGAGHGGNCSPVKTEYHVPFIFWYSDSYKEKYGDKVYQAREHKKAKINGDCSFYSICDMADISIDSAYSKQEWSVFSPNFKEHKRLILVPDGKTCIEVE